MNKKLSLATLGIVSSTLIGCSNQVESIQPIQQNQQVSAQSNLGLNNIAKNIVEIVFLVLDKDKDGFLTLNEYTSSPNSNSEENKMIFKKLDKNNDGKISLEDAKSSSKLFLPKMVFSKESMREQAKNEFNRHDTNKDGVINESEFDSAIKMFSYFLFNNSDSDNYKNIKETFMNTFLFESSDKNNDNKISFSEYEDFYYNMMFGMMKASVLSSSTTQPTP
ncbi:MAG: EF-hand domain-containing protein [Candidatus Sericytochromatia bacterium]